MIDRLVAIDSGQGEKSYKRISELASEPFLVLLGEPGMGKSSVFEVLAQQQGLELITVRQLLNGAGLDSSRRLYVDSFDEFRSDGREADKACKLAETIKAAGLPSWWLSCRGQDWRELSDLRELQRTTGDKKIVVASLEPLARDEARAILRALGARDPDVIVKQVEKIGAPAFLENPLMVRLLYEASLGGETIPPTRFEIYQAAIQQMIAEWNPDYARADRSSAEERISTAAKACLLLLATGAGAIWRSNLAPPNKIDGRSPLAAYHIGSNSRLVASTLDTALFRGQGSLFSPVHRSITEFLAAKALTDAINGSHDRAALPLSRAVALINGPDGLAPTELRGLFAWLAAHLASAGNIDGAAELVNFDPLTVLSYGDAGVLGTKCRKLLLEKIDRDDPFPKFRGNTPFGALAGEDLAEDFKNILEKKESSAKAHVVLAALRSGRPIESIRPFLRNLAFDQTLPSWFRLQVVDGWINGSEEPDKHLRELFEALDSEPMSADREELRADLAARLPKTLLSLAELKAVLVAFEQHQRPERSGGLYQLQRRLEDDPIPDLFDEPIANWRSDVPYPLRTFEVDRLLERALIAAIHSEPKAPRLTRWLSNSAFETLADDDVREAVQEWLDADPDREITFVEALIEANSDKENAWFFRNRYTHLTGRFLTKSARDSVFAHARSAIDSNQRRMAEIVVDLTLNSGDVETYWSAYTWLAGISEHRDLLRELTQCEVLQWRLDESQQKADLKKKADATRQKNIKELRSQLSAIQSGQNTAALTWGAERYRRSGASSSVARFDRLVSDCDLECATAIAKGWQCLLANGMQGIDDVELGKLHGRNQGFRSELAMVTGLDFLLQRGRSIESIECSTTVALSLIRWAMIDGVDREEIRSFADACINRDPTLGGNALLRYWRSMLEVGSDSLEVLWHLTDNKSPAECPAATRAIEALLAERPSMNAKALQGALTAAVKILEKGKLAELARLALADVSIGIEQRAYWRFVEFALNPVDIGPNYRLACSEADADADNFARQVWASSFCDTLLKARANDIYRSQEMIALIGPRCGPDDRFKSSGGVHHDFAEVTERELENLFGSGEPQALEILKRLANDPDLSAWTNTIKTRLADALRAERDRRFKHPTVTSVLGALAGKAPINARDLRAVTVDELQRLKRELRTTSDTLWKRFWGPNLKEAYSENECRDIVLMILRERLAPYKIAAVLAEGQRVNNTRADILTLSGAGKNLPIEAKRHNNPDLWIAASTQLQGYAADPGADGYGIYLVFWFGLNWGVLPARPDRAAKPTNANDLEQLLISDLTPELRACTDVVVFDVSKPNDRPFTRRRKSSPSDA